MGASSVPLLEVPLGLNVLVWPVGLSAIVCAVQRHSGNDAVVTAFFFSFLEKRRNHKGPNHARKECGGSHPRFSSRKFQLVSLGEQLRHKLGGDTPHVRVFP
jgi:hypothetical protein